MTRRTGSKLHETALPRHPATAYEVARRAGVSQSAVSRAFTPGSSISEPMRRKVRQAASELNYRPNLIARSLAMRRSNTVGVIVPPLENPYFSALLEALAASFKTAGYRLLLFTADRADTSDPVLEDVLHARVDALVMISASMSSHFAEQCQTAGLPIVLMNRKSDSRSVSSVTGSNAQGAETIARFLLEGGHRRLAYIAGLEDASTSRDREEAFTAYLASQGKHLVGRAVGHFSFASARAAAFQLLSAKVRPDAIFCANDLMAIAALQAARYECGLEVGREISIVGFDDMPMAAWPAFDLTTFQQPAAAMANHALKLLLKQLRARGALAEERVIPGELIVRSSARLPRNAAAWRRSGTAD